jgi:hypothetical protein
MNKRVFVEQLRETVETLKPFTSPPSAGAKHWDGTAYVEGDTMPFEPQALAWWSTLTAVAEVIDNRDTPLSEKQIAYLNGLLFGGMGSLNDLSIAAQSTRAENESIDAMLDRQRRRLFVSFKG